MNLHAQCPSSTVSVKHIDGLSFVDNELQSVGQSIGVENTLGEAHGPIG
jgi:hypothetical protein